MWGILIEIRSPCLKREHPQEATKQWLMKKLSHGSPDYPNLPNWLAVFDLLEHRLVFTLNLETSGNDLLF
jgi:hypothetical protein